MNDEFREVVFEVRDTNLEQAGFDSSFQALLRKELLACFPSAALDLPAGPIILKLVRSSRGNLHWEFQDSPRTKYYVKTSFGQGRPDLKKLDGYRKALVRACLITQSVTVPADLKVLSSNDGWIVLEILHFVEKRLTLDQLLKMGLHLPIRSFRAMGMKIARSVGQVHNFNPTPEMIGIEEYTRFLTEGERQKMYIEALEDIIKRAEIYLPLGKMHPFLLEEEKVRLLRGIGKFYKNWRGRGERFCLVHGDVHRGNIMPPVAKSSSLILLGSQKTDSEPKWRWDDTSTSLGVALIDFSPRVQMSEPRWDDGRFVGDLLELYFEKRSKHDKKRVKALIDGFINTSVTLSGDRLYKKGLVWGIFSMTLLKFYQEGRPIKDREVARAYFDNSLRIIEQGYFSWP